MPQLPPVDLPAEAPAALAAGTDGEALRESMRRVASPVVVVTARPAGGAPRGATIGSFTSVALDPPIVSFNVTRGTRIHETLMDSDRFAVHLLAHDQADIAAHFADPGLDAEEQFAPFRIDPGEAGAPPVFGSTLGVVLCRSQGTFEAGDHTVVLGRVLDVVPGRDAPPLVYHRQAYRTVAGEG
jgi:flavin reductase (DIM6/NTAB) family NADH-FMN oxidoreductase RutF